MDFLSVVGELGGDSLLVLPKMLAGMGNRV